MIMLGIDECVMILGDLHNDGIYTLDTGLFLSFVCTLISRYNDINPDNGTIADLVRMINIMMKIANDKEV